MTDYRPCELCGSLVSPLVEPAAGESIVCEACLRTRRVRADQGEPASEPALERYKKHIHKFRCVYCGRKLRSKPVARAIKLACPACGGHLRLAPGGQVSAYAPTGGSSDRVLSVEDAEETNDPDV